MLKQNTSDIVRTYLSFHLQNEPPNKKQPDFVKPYIPTNVCGNGI